MDKLPDKSTADAKDFLLEEYRALSDAMSKNEEVGETRVNWFIGIVTAAGAGLAALSDPQKWISDTTFPLILIGSLFALLVFGAVTLFRIIKRNSATDGFKKDLAVIRQIFKHHFDPTHVLLNHKPFGPGAIHSEGLSLRKFGGLADIVLAINSLLLAALAGAISSLLKPDGPMGMWIATVAVFFIVAWVGQRKYVRHRENETKSQLRDQPLTHAGGVVFWDEGAAIKYLLIRPKKKGLAEWLLPKGHIEEKEKPDDAAQREVREETGVEARLVRPIGIVEFTKNSERIRAKFYLMKRVSEDVARQTETREHQWFSFEEALQRASHDQTKELLELANKCVLESRANVILRLFLRFMHVARSIFKARQVIK